MCWFLFFVYTGQQFTFHIWSLGYPCFSSKHISLHDPFFITPDITNSNHSVSHILNSPPQSWQESGIECQLRQHGERLCNIEALLQELKGMMECKNKFISNKRISCWGRCTLSICNSSIVCFYKGTTRTAVAKLFCITLSQQSTSWRRWNSSTFKFINTFHLCTRAIQNSHW